jgi:peroxiredoxin
VTADTTAVPTGRRTLLLAGGVAALAALAGAGVAWQRMRPQPAADDAVALLFAQTLPDAGGRPVALATFAGQPLVVNFWATWCPPCVEEMPELSALHDEWSPRGLRMIGIGIDSAEKIGQFSAKLPVSYPLLVAGLGGTEIGRRFGNQAGLLPYTVLIDRRGHVAQRILGRVDIGRLRAVVARMVG